MTAAGPVSDEQAKLEWMLDLTCRYLGVDAAFLWDFRNGCQECRAVAGDADSFHVKVGDVMPAERSYSHRVISGEIPNVVPDTRSDPRVSELAVTRDCAIGAYAAMPVHCPGGDPRCILAGLSHQPRPGLDSRMIETLALLIELSSDDGELRKRRERARSEIRRLVEGDGIEVAYQPMLDVRTGSCIGLEALARFPEPYQDPARTFAEAHAQGLGVELEVAVLRRAVGVVSSLAAGQFLAVNISPRALLYGRRLSCVKTLPIPKLVVEITEHAAVDAYAALRDELRPLREQGLRIAVDDAGAGYASLRHILELRPDFIKLDRWLIDGLADDRGRRVAVGSFVSLARELGGSVIAEGVERAEDLAAVGELGLDAVQGFLLARPSVDHDDVARWCTSSEAAPEEAGGAERAVDATGAVLLGAGYVAVPPVLGGTVGRELARLELDRRVSQRLEAVGQLAAGIAHEINTPLQYVGDSVSFLRDAVDELVRLIGLYRETLHTDTAIPLAQRRRSLREADQKADVDYLCARIPAAFERTVDGIARVRSIVQAMKRFSHAGGSELAPADINEAIETTLVVCRNEYKYVADVTVELGELPDVVCNIGQLNQVFLNLIINAAQAIEENTEPGGERGRITIRSRRRGDCVVIEIADTGPGIPPALMDRIYDPFFTTKPVGKGTGQGLALAQATVRRHGGSLDCASTPGRGTTFTITLPLECVHAPAVAA